MESYGWYEAAARRAFHALTERFGFAHPQTERLGRESYVRFRKGTRFVSIAWEPGTAPIVELFLPSAESGDPPLPWAERDGVAYSRRFPRHGAPSAELRRDPSHRSTLDWRNPTPEMFETYLSREAERLIEVEPEFLSGGE